MFLSVCSNPQSRPILASSILVSFILLCGFILVSLTVASVTSGINERLKDLELEEGVAPGPAAAAVPRREGEVSSASDVPPPPLQTTGPSGAPVVVPSPSPLINRSLSGVLAAKLTSHGGQQTLLTHREMLLMVLIQLWRKEELYVNTTQPVLDRQESGGAAAGAGTSPSPSRSIQRHLSTRTLEQTNRYCHFKIQSIFLEVVACVLAFRDLDLRSMSIHMRSLTSHPLYKYLLAATIASAALFEILLLERASNDPHRKSSVAALLQVAQLVLQIYFTMDVMAQVLSHYPSCVSFFTERWNQYDLVLILVTWIPTLATGLAIQRYLGE
jgi:hypothetical protein